MNPRTRHPLDSSYRPGYVHPAGSEVVLLEPLDPERRVWIVELRVPDESLVGGAWYDHAELNINEMCDAGEQCFETNEVRLIAVPQTEEP